LWVPVRGFLSPSDPLLANVLTLLFGGVRHFF
jgi:hypothetical protein